MDRDMKILVGVVAMGFVWQGLRIRKMRNAFIRLTDNAVELLDRFEQQAMDSEFNNIVASFDEE